MWCYSFCLNLPNLCTQVFLCKLYQYLNILGDFYFSLFQECSFNKLHDNTALRVSYQETFESIQITNATDGILSLTAMNVVVPCRSTQSFTLTGLEGFLMFSVVISLKVIVRTLHGAQSALNSG